MSLPKNLANRLLRAVTLAAVLAAGAERAPACAVEAARQVANMRACRTANASWPFCDDAAARARAPPPFWIGSKLTEYEHALETHPSRTRDKGRAAVHVHAARTDGELARFGKLPNRSAAAPYLLFFNGINCDYVERRKGSKAPRAPRAAASAQRCVAALAALARRADVVLVNLDMADHKVRADDPRRGALPRGRDEPRRG